MPYQQTIITPGFYEGTGRAKLLHTNQQAFLLQNTRNYPAALLPGAASIAIQLERIKAAFYPWGCAVQVQFSGDPGGFGYDIQGAEDDTDAMYVTIQQITQVNASFVGRISIMQDFPKFLRVQPSSLANDVLQTVLVTR